ncbi:lysozyme inhibitor LprI family protein [Novosphingobium sp. B1]|uniref:lysozyme inhibitor LprI family protein n=1 Tax=Novosphingobium sp. B1 TaxID=1938756 RepID=UPI0009D8598A|nr:hypothetical protein [Novosphingobium sp. B1]SMD03411.1 hypothetical protein SAMN06272759_12416 [Novosphingobium sp. B1]
MTAARIGLGIGMSAALALAHAQTSATPGRTNGPSFNGPSFSCAKVGPESVEALICSDAELSRLDQALAKSFQDTVAAIDVLAAVTDMRIEHRSWLAERRMCLGGPRAVQRECVANMYKDRLGRLSLWRDGTLVEEYR